MAAPFEIDDCGTARSVHFECRADRQAGEEDAIRDSDYTVCTISMQDAVHPDDVFRQMGEALKFPDDHGAYVTNPNAFLDWLTDLSWIEGFRGAVIRLEHSEVLWARWPYETGVLVEVWLRAAD